jgi:hypothetical protein
MNGHVWLAWFRGSTIIAVSDSRLQRPGLYL